MSETAAALLILPMLVALVILLEGTRLCCTHLINRRRARQYAKAVSTQLEPTAHSGQQWQA